MELPHLVVPLDISILRRLSLFFLFSSKLVNSRSYHTNKWYMHKPTSVLENDTYKLLCDLDIQTDHQKTRPYNNQPKKKREFAKLWTFLSRLATE